MSFIEDEIERLRQMCIACGKCSRGCPSLKHGGLDPLEVMMGSDEGLETCIGCGTCSQICHRTDPATVMRDIICLQQGIHVSQAFHDTGYTTVPQDVPSRIELVPEWTGDDIDVMPGCIVECRVPFIKYAASIALKSMGLKARELPNNTCCMHPIMFREMHETERRAYKAKMGASAGGKPILTLCAGCSDELANSGIDAEHIIPLLHRNIDSLPKFDKPLKVAVEPGCSAMPLKKEMMAVVKAMGCESVGKGMGCCGKNVSVSVPLMAEREEECADADLIVVGCPMCFIKYDSQPGGKPVVHIAELVAMAAGDFESLRYHAIPFGMQRQDRIM